jgi:UDP-N-acetylmuramate dehydrogenase
MNIQENIALKDISTFKIGGKAQYLVYAENQQDIIDSLRFAQEKDLPIGLIGSGCNLLIQDDDIEGLILKMNTKSIEIKDNQLFAEAGVSLAMLANFGHKANLVGLEWAPSVPSSVGGAIRGNAGAFGGETKDKLKQIRVYRDGAIEDIDSSGLDFHYRYSSFKEEDNTDIILGGLFELEKGDIEASRMQIRDNIIKKSQNQPVGVACSGCIFKNYEGFINENLYSQYPDLKVFVAKGIIPSGYLIQEAGLKGFTKGGIQISEKHGNYMINTGTGTYEDVIKLIDIVKKRIFELFSVHIEEEVVYLHKQMKKR